MSRIFIVGDTHFTHDIRKLNTRNFPLQKQLTKNDYVIVLGDFGVLFDSQDLGNAIPSNPSDTCWSAEELYWLNWYDEKPFTTLWLDGNHENFDRIDT